MLLVWNLFLIFDKLTFILDPLKWWFCLCYPVSKDIKKNKPKVVSLKTPRRKFISFDKILCLLSYYQLQGSHVWIGTLELRKKDLIVEQY